MTNRLTDKKVFNVLVNARNVVITCYTQTTRGGFRHIAFLNDYGIADFDFSVKDIKNKYAKLVYGNRAWESFQYANLLAHCIEKYVKENNLGNDIKQHMVDVLINKKAEEIAKENELQFQAFTNVYNKLNKHNKEILKTSALMETEQDAQAMMQVMKMMVATQELGGKQ